MSTVAIRTKAARVMIISKRIDGARHKFFLYPQESDNAYYTMPKDQWEELISGNALVAQRIEDGSLVVKDKATIKGGKFIDAEIKKDPFIGNRPMTNPAPATIAENSTRLNDVASGDESDENTETDNDSDEQTNNAETESFIQDLDITDPDVKGLIADYAQETFNHKINKTKTVANMIEELRSL